MRRFKHWPIITFNSKVGVFSGELSHPYFFLGLISFFKTRRTGSYEMLSISAGSTTRSASNLKDYFKKPSGGWGIAKWNDLRDRKETQSQGDMIYSLGQDYSTVSWQLNEPGTETNFGLPKSGESTPCYE